MAGEVAASLLGLMTPRQRRTYDYRVKAQSIAAGDPTLVREVESPRSASLVEFVMQ